jgi:signal peptidase I
MNPWKRRAVEIWAEWLRPFLIVVVALSSFRSAVADWNDVPSGSMRPSIVEGDRIFVNKLAFDLKVPFTQIRLATWSHPKRGDVVVLYSPADGTRLVKRVVGVPGDTLEMRRNRLFVNGEPAEYEPGVTHDEESARRIAAERQVRLQETVLGREHAILLTPGVASPKSFAPLTVPADHYYVMGDNRDQSGDSRSFGLVPRRSIVGRTSRVVLSLDRERYFLPRWNRFLHPIP